MKKRNIQEISISLCNKTWRTDQSDFAVKSENLKVDGLEMVQIIFAKGKDHNKYLSSKLQLSHLH